MNMKLLSVSQLLRLIDSPLLSLKTREKAIREFGRRGDLIWQAYLLVKGTRSA